MATGKLPTAPDWIDLKAPTRCDAGKVVHNVADSPSWDLTVSPTLRFESERRFLFAVGGGVVRDCLDPDDLGSEALSETPSKTLVDRIHLRIFVPRDPAPLWTQLEISVASGWGCEAEEEVVMLVTPSGKRGPISVIQISGLLSRRFEVRGRIVLPEDAANEGVTFSIETDRMGPPYQLRWNPDGTVSVPTFPAPAAAVAAGGDYVYPL